MTMNPLDHINGLVAEAVADAAVAAGLVSREELPGITLEVPKDKSHGDLATGCSDAVDTNRQEESATNC